MAFNKKETSSIVRSIDLVIRNLGDNAPALTLTLTLTSRKRHISEVLQVPPARQHEETSDLCDHDHVNNIHQDNELEYEYEYNYAPVGLEQQYNELYQLLEKGLIGIPQEATTKGGARDKSFKKTNVSALLMGARGQGKSLVLERCLMALRQKQRKIAIEASFASTSNTTSNNTASCSASASASANNSISNNVGFRVVRLNGILLRGQNVTVVVTEIVKQLREIAALEKSKKKRLLRLSMLASKDNAPSHTHARTSNTHEIDHASVGKESHAIGKNPNADVTAPSDDDAVEEKLHAIEKKEAHRFRTRTTTFNSTMACLDEAFQLSCIDSIPILIVLDELDSFLPKISKKDLQSNPSVGDAHISSSSSSSRDLLLYHLLDRIAGKGSLISLVGICARLTTTSSYEKRVRSRAQGTSKIVYFNFGKDDDESNKTGGVYASLVEILLSNFNITMKKEGSFEAEFVEKLKNRVRAYLLPQSQEGQGLNDEKAMDQKFRIHDVFKVNKESGKSTRWFCRVLSLALTFYVTKVQETQNEHEIPDFDESYLMEGLSIMGADAFVSEHIPGAIKGGQHEDRLSVVTPRLQDLMDLSGSQVAVLLSAKRILSRDAQSEDDKLPTKVLTYERIRREYESYFIAQGKSSGADRYDEVVFFKAFLHMLDVIFFPAKDGTGGGPYQYFFSKKFSAGGMRHEILKKTPLHICLDIEKDVMKAMSTNKLKCSAALKEWAKTSGT